MESLEDFRHSVSPGNDTVLLEDIRVLAHNSEFDHASIVSNESLGDVHLSSVVARDGFLLDADNLKLNLV